MNDLFYPLHLWQLTGRLRALDLALVRLLWQQCPELTQEQLVLFAMCSERQRQGHVCLPLAQLSHWLGQSQDLSALAREQQDWLQAWALDLPERLALAAQQLPASAVLARTDQQPPTNEPLVLDCRPPSRLYLHRFWRFEQQLSQLISQRLSAPTASDPTFARLLQQLFAQSAPPTSALDWQQVACALAARSRFAVITGGPGTGKTTTVVKLLALLQGQRLLTQQPLLDIRLAAPTGKAAARLQESISKQVQALQPDADAALSQAIRDSVPLRVTTLHRLLKPQGTSRRFAHHAQNPLLCDLVVVDEASMVDLEMMASLMQALPAQSSLILLGDKDQLASVEAGSVLADLCASAEQGQYLPSTQAWLSQLGLPTLPSDYLDERGSALAQACSMLRHSYRFDASGGIGALAQLVNDRTLSLGRKQRAWQAVLDQDPEISQVAHHHWAPDAPELQAFVVAGYDHYLRFIKQHRPGHDASDEQWQHWAFACLTAFNDFQLLTAVREGECGSLRLNERIQHWLMQQGRLDSDGQDWFVGRPVIITRNDYQLQLMNGDLGLCLPLLINNEQHLVVVFSDPERPGCVRWFLTSRLQQFESVFAMTVHKSQGSEFRHCALMLPQQINPVLSKELLYTAITRAKQRFSLVCESDAVLHRCLSQPVERSSGLGLNLSDD